MSTYRDLLPLHVVAAVMAVELFPEYVATMAAGVFLFLRFSASCDLLGRFLWLSLRLAGAGARARG